MNFLQRLSLMFSRCDLLKIAALFALMVIGAFLELLGIGMIMPVIAMLAEPGLMEQNKYLKIIYDTVNPASEGQFLLILCAVVAALYAGKNIYLAFLAKVQALFIFNKVKIFGVKLFERYLKAPYAFHLRRNSSGFINNLLVVGSIANGFLMPLMQLATEAVVVAAILAAMLALAPSLTLALAAVSAALAVGLHLALRNFNASIGMRLQTYKRLTMRDAMQSLEGIKECKVLNCDAFLTEQYAHDIAKLRMAEGDQFFVGQIPRFSIEAFVVVAGMGALATLILSGVASGSIVLRLSFIAVAMVRLMPSLSRINYYLSSLRHQMPAFNDILDDFIALSPQSATLGPPITLEKSIRLESVSFRYEGAKADTVSSISVEIPKNSSVAFVGQTGCGKTTLMDVILGLLKPSSGRALVDGRDIEENLPSWQTKIGYVPQVIHLADDSIRANVAYCIPKDKIDDAQVARCLEMAQLKEFADSLPEGVETEIGERGVRLSGGQRQRIGIARALYRNPEILALDEATSALDNDTEKAFVDALKKLKGKLTIIMIAHRLTTVENCDKVISLQAE